MKSLIVEDDFTSRRLMQLYLMEFGDSNIAVDGHEVIDAFWKAVEENSPYDLICLDIMMPNMDGTEALWFIRQIESKHGIKPENGVKVIVTTAKQESQDVFGVYEAKYDAYLVKPIKQEELVEEIKKLGLLEGSSTEVQTQQSSGSV